MILLWLLPLAAILHIVEEFVFPGGFAAWYRNYQVLLAASFTSRYLVIVNVVLVVLCILPRLLDSLNGIAFWLPWQQSFSLIHFSTSGAPSRRRGTPLAW
jgi:hypothetical protein